MLIAIEAEIDTNGIVTLLEPVTIKRKTRAVVTLLDVEPTAKPPFSAAEKQAAEERLAQHFGAVKSGDSRSADNDKIDADLARAYDNDF